MQKIEKVRKKTGGRTKGTPNKATKEFAQKVIASGMTPLEFMLKVMRDSRRDLPTRMDAAKAVAPYVHAKLASIEVAGTGRDGALLVQLTSSDASL